MSNKDLQRNTLCDTAQPDLFTDSCDNFKLNSSTKSFVYYELPKHNRSPQPIPALTDKQIERFWKKVDKRGPEECWLWKGGTSQAKKHLPARYGLWQSKIKGGALRPHRVSYVLAYGPIPEGMTVDHVAARGCTSTLCCNPAHLEAVTGGENTQRYYRNLKTCKRGHDREPMSGPCLECKRHNDRERIRLKRAGKQSESEIQSLIESATPERTNA